MLLWQYAGSRIVDRCFGKTQHGTLIMITDRNRITETCLRITKTGNTLLILLGLLLGLGVAAPPRAHGAQTVVQQFFVPFTETDFQTSLQAIAGGTSVGTNVQTVLSIVVGTTNTVLIYDHWEDGYENDLNNPVQATTQIWGDGILTNGVAPGTTNDVLALGSVITLTNIVSLPRNPSTFKYDGRDRIGATRAVTLSRAGWTTTIGTLLASSTEVYDTTRYGTFFMIPVGTNTTPAVENFNYSSLHIIASQNGTTVTVDKNGDGSMDVTNNLNMGESMFVNGGVAAGATVTASKPVQVHELTGRTNSNYQSRTFAVRPTAQWDTSYFAPAGTTTTNNAHAVFLFNQYTTNIIVQFSGQGTNGSLTVPAKGNFKLIMPLNSGAQFFTTNGTTFYAVGCNDCGSTSTGNNQNYDWGYALLPAAALTPVVIVGWAPGSDDQNGTAGPDQNGSPVWVTPTKATTLYVNYSGNYNVGPFTAPNGHKYDTNYTLPAFQFQRIFNPTTRNMTGARIFTADSTTFAAAWGEDPSNSSQGAPYFDLGNGIIPFPVPTILKSSARAVDADGDGRTSVGDTLEYTIHVQNLGMLVLGNVLVLDALPTAITYVSNSTSINGTPVADNLVPPATSRFPLDEAGLILPQIDVGGYTDIKYRVVINAGATSISNSVLGSAGSDPVTSAEHVYVAVPISIAFSDSLGTNVSAYLTNTSVYVTLYDSVQNTNSATVQTVTVLVTNLSNGDYESVLLVETGTNTGIFRNTNSLPLSVTGGGSNLDGTLRAAAGNNLIVAYTDSLMFSSASANAVVVASPFPTVTKTSQLFTDVNTNGLINWGDTVRYTITLTNSSALTISNLVVRDTLAGNVTYVTSSTTSNGVAVADSGSTAFPLDEGGFSVARLPRTNVVIQFRVTANSGTTLSNSVAVSNSVGQVVATDVASVVPPPPTCNMNFSDAIGNPLGYTAENAGIYVTISDTTLNVSASIAESVSVIVTNLSNGDIESLLLVETGTNTGVFRNTSALPCSTVAGQALQNGTLYAKAGQSLTVRYAGVGGEVCSAAASMVPAIQTKKLYLSALLATNQFQNLDRVDPVAASKLFTSNSIVISNGISATFVQTPSFCSPFTLPSGMPVAITNYITNFSGAMPASPPIQALLKKGTNAATATTMIALTNASFAGGVLGWSGTLATNYNLSAGDSIFLVVTSAQTGVRFAIQYNSMTRPSAISMPTVTVISLDTLGMYSAPYPGGTLLTNANNGQTVYIRATASDPFGAYDVTTLSVYSLNPGGYSFTTNLATSYLVASNSCSRTYEYPWVTENWQGSYSILATAYEGTEGITNAAFTTLQVNYPPGGTPSTVRFIDGSGNLTNSYVTNQTICVRVTDLNMNLNPAATETVNATITSSSGDSETVVLSETGTNTGIFTACLPSNTNSPSLNNGTINVPGGGNLAVTYTDPINPSDTSSDNAIILTPPGPRPVISLFKTLVSPANGQVLLNGTVQYDIQIGNPGSITVTNVQVTDTFPTNRLNFVSATITPNSNTPPGTLTWTNVGPIPSGGSVTLSTFFTARLAGAVTNSVSVSGSTNVGPVTAVASTTGPAMSVVKTVLTPIPGPAYINSNVVFRLAITNIGTTSITTWNLQDTFSSACFQFLGSSVTPAGSGGGLILWSGMSSLPVGGSTNIYVTNKVIGTCEPAFNTATITSGTDQNGTAVPTTQGQTSITNAGGTISGTIFYDANVNGTNDSGDSVLSSVIVFADINNDGVRQGSEPFATTGTNGQYQIIALPSGAYSARVDTNSLPAGLRPTYDLDGTNTAHSVSLTMTNGQVVTNLNYGYVGSGSISGFLWEDADGNQVKGSGEPLLSGINVFIDLNGNGVRENGEPYTTTLTNGTYAFTNLIADTYRVTVDLLSIPTGVSPTYDTDGTGTPDLITVFLGAGQNSTANNFGYKSLASLSGNVTNAVTGLPVAGVTVVVIDHPGAVFTVTTDSSGYYVVTNLWVGPSSITASKAGYNSTNATPIITPGANVQNFLLSGNTLSGVVTNAVTGLPISGATVQVVDSANVTNTVTTDGSGNYSVSGVATGAATVTASKTGYGSSTATPTIVLGANTQNLQLSSNTLSGVVTNAVTGLPIAGVTVQVVDSANVTNVIVTGAGGTYSVTNIATGVATITASKTGYGSTTASPTIVAGANTRNLQLTANTLTGIVTNSVTGLPISGVTVQVVDSANVTNVIVTGAGGTYAVTNIAAGAATVTASKTGYASTSASPTIVAGANVQNLALTGNTLTGIVTNTLTGLPISGVTVQVVDSANVTNVIVTGAGGTYAVTNIATGVATITASKAGYGSTSATPTIVAGANIRNLGLTGNTLTGIVTNSVTGLPISGVTVQVVDSANVTNIIVTGAGGTYAVTNIAVGTATVTASKNGYGTASASPAIAAGANVQNLALTGNTLSGVVTNAVTGLPISGATVQVVDSANVTNIIVTGAGGNYAVTNIATGVATVTASKTGYASASASPTIVAGANVRDLGLTGNTLTGIVTNTVTGLPISGATVQVVDSANVTNIIITGAGGTYGVTNIATGVATVTASLAGYGSATASPTIVAGANVRNLGLTGNTLTGIVTNSVTGLPISGATVEVVDSANTTNIIVTGVGGTYGVTNIAVGAATVTASKTGYGSSSASPTIVVGANVQNLALAGNTLTGVITNGISGLPIAGVTVQVVDSANITNTIVTGAGGDYTVTNIAVGAATVTASKTGYASASASPAIVSGANIQDLQLIGNTLAGVVTNTISGLPIAGVTVQVVDSANVTNILTTDVAGHYAVTNIAVGVATVTASKTGYGSASASPTIIAGANVQDLGLTGNTLAGVVTNAVTGLPIAGVTVSVVDSANVTNTLTTDINGYYAVTNISVGTATVTGSKTGYGSSSASPTIAVGANIQNLQLIGNTLAGIVTNSVTGLPISGVTVQVVDSANVTNTLTTDAGGHYAVTNIAVGLATVTGSKSGYGSTSASPAIVAGANVQNLQLTGNTLTGIVTNSVTGLPIAGVTVQVVDSANFTNTLTTDAGGHYAVTNIAVGLATVTGSKTGYGSTSAGPTIVAGANIQDLELTGNTLAGVVTNSVTGLPIAGVTVQVVDSANVTNTIATDGTGHYAVTNIAAGVASVTASKSGYASTSASPTIVAGANVQDLSLTGNTLTGVVTNGITGLPIAGVTVRVVDLANVTNTITTDASGYYAVTNITVGLATVTGTKTGYGPASASPTIVAGANVQNLQMSGNTLAGIVTNSNTGLPISGVTVTVVDSASVTNILTTDGGGHYAVTNIAAGLATVTGSKAGYVPTGASPTIVAGANIQDLQLSGNTLAGIVTNSVTGLPISGVTVQVVDSANVTNIILTGVGGTYAVTNIASGAATVTGSKAGYGSTSASPTIVAGANVQNLQLTGNTLAGVVTNSVTGLPIAGATVQVVDSANITNTLTTDAGGHYAVTNIAVGVASVTASKSGYASASANPTIVPGANIQDLALSGNTLAGVVTNAVTGLPIAGATVRVVDSANITNTITTDVSGYYAVTNIATGAATVTANKTGYASASASPSIVPGANIQDLALTGNTLSGVVTNALSGLPIAGVTVRVVDSANVTNTIITDGSGYYAVTNIATGAASVTGSKAGYGSTSATPTIVAGANVQNLQLVGNTLAGVVTNAVTGAPIAGASVQVVDSASVTYNLTTDAGGHYAVTNLATGAATVSATKSGYSSSSATPTIVAGANVQNLQLYENTLTGIITDSTTHAPILGATVLVIDFAGATNSITTDINGFYGVTNLATGIAGVAAGKVGYNTTNGAINIVPGLNTLNLELTPGNPTLALISSFKATVAKPGVTVQWTTASEIGSVSFDVYRRDNSGKWVRVNQQPVLASGSVNGSSYETADAQAKSTGRLVYQLTELEESGTVRTYGPFTITPARAAATTVARTTTAPARTIKPRTSTAKTNSTTASTTGTTVVLAPSVPLTSLDGTRFVKIATTNGGWQMVTASSLATLLSQPVSTIQSAILSGQFHLANQGLPVVTLPAADGNSLGFYADALKNNYTAQNIYWLTYAANAVPATLDGQSPTATGTGYYPATVSMEQDLLALPTIVQSPDEDFWMWQKLVGGIPSFDTGNYNFAVDHRAAGGDAAQLTLRLVGGDDAVHIVQASLNGTLLGSDTWTGRSPRTTTLSVPASLLLEGTNKLTLKAVRPAGGPLSQWYLNSFALTYSRQYFVSAGGTLCFSANSNSIITVDGFSDPAIKVLDITDAKQPALVQNLTVKSTVWGYSASFVPAGPLDRFVAVQPGAGTPAAAVTIGKVASLAAATNTADYIVLAPDSLIAGAANLAAYRQQHGLHPIVVRLESVYNEFGAGVATPEAIHKFLATAANQWTLKPRYLVLIGDGTYDYRDLLQKHDNLMPPMLVSTAYGLFGSDSAYGDVNGDGQPPIAVGRLPVKTADQLTAVIQKIKGYEALPPQAHGQALLLGDTPDSAGDFAASVQKSASALTGAYSNTVLQASAQTDAAALHDSVQTKLNAGVDLMNYMGHGAIDRFGNAGYLTSTDATNLHNSARLPVVLAVTCIAGQYSVPGSDCLAEYLMLNSSGGAIAVISPTGLSENADGTRLGVRLVSMLRANTLPAVGDMFRTALSDYVAKDEPVIQPAMYNLIGDPAIIYNVVGDGVIAPLRILSANRTVGGLNLNWSGGLPPYQLEISPSLEAGANWQPIGAPVSGTNTIVPATAPAGFIRIRSNE